MIGIVSTPVPLQHGQVKYAIYQQPHALLLFDVTIQLPTQCDLVTQLDQQLAWCQLHNHLDSMQKPSIDSHMVEKGTAGAKTKAVGRTSWRLRCSGS